MIPTLRPSHLLAAGALAAATSVATANVTSAYYLTYTVVAEEFGGTPVTKFVADVYVASDDPCGVILNVYNWNSPSWPGCLFQSFTGTGWSPGNLGGPFDNTALRRADSFVTIGTDGPYARTPRTARPGAHPWGWPQSAQPGSAVLDRHRLQLLVRDLGH